MTTVIWALVVLVSIALVASVLLYVVSQRFKVEEDPRIDEVEAALPGANCGACGNPGCRGFAVEYVLLPGGRECGDGEDIGDNGATSDEKGAYGGGGSLRGFAGASGHGGEVGRSEFVPGIGGAI